MGKAPARLQKGVVDARGQASGSVSGSVRVALEQLTGKERGPGADDAESA